MKKKVVSLLTAMALTAMTLAGCGSSTAADSTDSTAAETTDEAADTEADADSTAAVTNVKAGFIFLHDENSTYDLNFMNAAKEEKFQFVRNGYFCVDIKDSEAGKPVFNRIVSLKSSFKLPK